MTFKPSSWLASAGFLLLVPGSIWLAYVGRDHGLYPRIAIPIVFGLLVAAGIVALFAVLPALKRWEQSRESDSH